MKRLTLALVGAVAAIAISTPASARHRHHSHHHVVQIADPGCNIFFPCEGVVSSRRGERISREMGFGAPQKHYRQSASALPHPSGCPSRAFCGCGAAVEVFGKPIRSLWLAANWLRFPRTAPAPGMVAARHGHVFVLKQQTHNGEWLVADYNSGGHTSRLHIRSLSGYQIVNPHG